jgi:UDP-N-acetylmuramate-alanine ligase
LENAISRDVNFKDVEVKNVGAFNLISYGKDTCAAYRYQNVIHTKDGLSFDIIKNGQTFSITSPMLGVYNAENITACYAMASEIGIAPEKIIAAIAKFKGIKRRLEKRYMGTIENSSIGNTNQSNKANITVLDCHAPTGEKARNTLRSIREIFPKPDRIIAVFEPNIGGRQRETLHLYEGAFDDADEIIIPRLTILKKDLSEKAEVPLDGQELAKIISKDLSETTPKISKKTSYIEDDQALVSHIIAICKADTIIDVAIVFLGSHGFRGMIEDTIARLTSSKNLQNTN